MARDFTTEETAVLDMLQRAKPIQYGKVTFEVTYEAGQRTHTRIVADESIPEKFRPGRRAGPASA